MKYINIFIFFLAFNIVKAGTFIDTVYSFTPGKGQNLGQGATFPKNIFGPPDTSARFDVPASSPETILSLGEGGEIIVGLKNGFIIDKPGPDFIIFENAFKKQVDDKIFAEPGLVSVSEDGKTFISFKFDSCSFKGAAGITPTNGDKDPFKPNECGGDAFDLAEVGLTQIKYIKINDISKIAALRKDCPYYSDDFMITGFDLDAVSILNYFKTTDDVIEDNSEAIIFNDAPFAVEVSCNNENLEVIVVDAQGIIRKSYAGLRIIINKADFTAGVYFIKALNSKNVLRSKFIVY